MTETSLVDVEETIEPSTDTAETQPPAAENPDELLYDATADQIIESQRVIGNKRYTLRMTFGSVTDEIAEGYLARTRVIHSFEADSPAVVDVDNDLTRPAVYLFDACAKQIEGAASAGDDWKDSILSSEKQAIVEQELIFIQIQVAPPTGIDDDEVADALPGELCPLQISAIHTHFEYKAFLRQSGKTIITLHTLRAATISEIEIFRALNKKRTKQIGSRFIQELPRAGKDLVALYDFMADATATKGFAGKVPLFVKYGVAAVHFGVQEALLQGN